MSNGKADTLEAANQVIILAFDLVDAVIPDTPALLSHALQSPPVQNAIKKTLLDFAQSKVKAGTTVVSNEEGQKLLESLESGIVDAATKDVIDQVKKTPQYARLEKGVGAFKKAAESSALGVWVDRNKGVLYVVGAALVVGTASVLYVTKTSGMPVSKAVDLLKDKKFQVLQIGSLKFQAALWDFRPDARVLGARVISTKQWEQVTLELKLGVLAQGSQVQEIDGAAIVKSGPFSLNLTGGAKPQVHEVNLGLKLEYSGVVDNGSFNIGIGAMYQNQQASGTLGATYKTGPANFGLQGQVGQKDGGGVQYGGMLTLSVDL